MLQCSISCSMERQGAMPVQKIHREPEMPEIAEKVDFAEATARLFTAGLGRVAEVQKKSLDIAVQQHNELLDLWKKVIQKVPGAPGMFLLDLDRTGFERAAETQKATIDLFVDQTRAFGDMVKERTGATTKSGDKVVDFAQQGVERAVATQKKVLESAAAQTRAVFDTAKQQFGVEGGPVEAAADSIQRGMSAIVDAQKELLDLAIR